MVWLQFAIARFGRGFDTKISPSLVGQGPQVFQHRMSSDPTSVAAKWHPSQLNVLSSMHECDRWQTTLHWNV